MFSNRKTRNNGEDKREKENDGQQLPDILSIEIKKDRQSWWAGVGLLSAQIHRVSGKKVHNSSSIAQNNYFYKDLTTLLKCNTTIHADVHFHQACWSKHTSWTVRLIQRTKELLIIQQAVIIIILLQLMALTLHAKVFCNVHLSLGQLGLLRPNHSHYLFSGGICITICSTIYFLFTFSSKVSIRSHSVWLIWYNIIYIKIFGKNPSDWGTHEMSLSENHLGGQSNIVSAGSAWTHQGNARATKSWKIVQQPQIPFYDDVYTMCLQKDLVNIVYTSLLEVLYSCHICGTDYTFGKMAVGLLIHLQIF